MQSDDETLAEDPSRALVAAGFGLGDSPEELLRHYLSDADARLRVIALRGAVRQGFLREDEWMGLLDDEDVAIRRDGARLIAYRDVLSDQLARRLVAALGDLDALVSERAAFALGEHHVVDAVDALCALARDHEDARCRESAVAALGAIGDRAGLPTIIAELDDKAPIRRRAIVALSNFEGPEVDAALERSRDDRDWQVRAAVTQLGRHEND